MLYTNIVFFKKLKRFTQIFLGFIIGFLLTFEIRSINYENFKKDIIHQLCSYQSPLTLHSFNNSSEFIHEDLSTAFSSVKALLNNKPEKNRNLVLVGVMTAKKFIDTRALTIYKTWAKDLDGHIIFFSSANSRTNSDLPLVALPGVDDSYPPQKKSFLMFKFLHDYFGDKYRFFMRADDDVFINVDRLYKFLENLNSSQSIFIGQTGVGNQQEFGQLNLNYKENFCMGGPGVIMSHKIMSKFAKNIDKCLQNLHSTHEDVEVGRCVKRHSGTSCTWSYDMQNLFYHNSSFQSIIQNDVFPAKELHNAITIHPIKDPSVMSKLYLYYKNEQHQDLRDKIAKVYREFNSLISMKNISILNLTNVFDYKEIPSLKEFVEKSKQFNLDATMGSSFPLDFNQTINWMFFSSKLYSELSINPKRHVEQHIVQAFNNNIQRIMSFKNKLATKKGRLLDYHSLNYGYIKFDSRIGIQYILDLLMIYRKYQGKRMTIPIRRHIYALQTFSEIQMKEIKYEQNIDQVLVNIIVPLSGRLSIFKRFTQNFINVYRSDSYVTMSIILFHEVDKYLENLEIKNIISELKLNYGIDIKILELNGTFSRGMALQKSITLFDDNSLLFFVDVDMSFNGKVLDRVRRNTVAYKQVYFPIVFSQYSNQINNLMSGNKTFSKNIPKANGYWRQFGFGILSLYKHDLLSVGGYNQSINGWGMEDVNLYDRIVTSNLTIFRAIDPDLTHVYHEIHCDQNLTSLQFEMCLGTKLSSLDSVMELARYINTFNLLS